MSAGSPKFTLSRIAALSLVSLWLAGCSNSNNPPAPVSTAGGASSSGTSSGMLITPPAKTGVSAVPQVQPVQTQPTQIQPMAQQPVAQQPVQTMNGKIVYNRKYGDIPKGSYTGGSSYTVKRGDTLFYIAWVTGNDFRDLAERNNIPAPYGLNVGQTLQVGNSAGQPITGDNAVAQASARASGGATVAAHPAQKSTAVVASQPTITYSESSGEQNANKMLPNNKPATTVVAPVTAPAISSNQPTASSTSTSSPISSWRWPTDGKVIENFSGAEGGNKGIDIAGSKGQAIVATADGRVVYAGNALRGYGNLIIIKHNDDYLSAYAHNDTMLVREQQEIKAGQKIATMGSTGTSSTRLHFEIRYKGKSVNPLQYLPQR
ncbi:murein hydrolase activator NlpD [Raoultella terrigena]|uniref:murein hydrolase activator NlpD n=1 Tax=Raoultella terrigena TaxID=577 RepID=UPI0005F7FEDD|nr:murein hydrolase activator NlpD [Raoultella terrigena]